MDSDQDVEVAPWRYGPARYWYDYLGVDEAGECMSVFIFHVPVTNKLFYDFPKVA